MTGLVRFDGYKRTVGSRLVDRDDDIGRSPDSLHSLKFISLMALFALARGKIMYGGRRQLIINSPGDLQMIALVALTALARSYGVDLRTYLRYST